MEKGFLDVRTFELNDDNEDDLVVKIAGEGLVEELFISLTSLGSSKTVEYWRRSKEGEKVVFPFVQSSFWWQGGNEERSNLESKRQPPHTPPSALHALTRSERERATWEQNGRKREGRMSLGYAADDCGSRRYTRG